MTEQEIYRAALDKWGGIKQMDQMIEEAAELIVALNHFKRDRTNAIDEVRGELADVELMLGQMKLLFNTEDDEIGFIKNQKIRRLGGRLHAP